MTIDALLAGAPPDADAIVSPVHPALTYRELRHRVAAIGAVLRDQGIGGQDRVAVVADDARQLAVSFLGIASHAICAPLNPAMTASEAESVVADLAPEALVVAAGAPFHDLPVPIIQLDIDTLVGGEATSPAQPHHVALLLTTSGTTARPKLVPLTHANLCASATNVARHLQLRPDDRALTVMPLFHIHGLVASLSAPLAAGGSVACLPSMDPSRVLDWMAELGPTWYTAAPTVHQAILDQVTRRGSPPPTASLRFVRSSSAPMARRIITDLEAALGVPVIEAYGMTEAAHQITSNRLPPTHASRARWESPPGPRWRSLTARW